MKYHILCFMWGTLAVGIPASVFYLIYLGIKATGVEDPGRAFGMSLLFLLIGTLALAVIYMIGMLVRDEFFDK